MKTPTSRRVFFKQAGVLTALLLLARTKLHAQLLNTPKQEKPVLPAKGEGIVILFQGDSITDGNRSRSNDPNLNMGQGYAFSIASRVSADHPDKRPYFINRGVSGNKVANLLARWDTDCIALNPDIVSILIGINDVDAAICMDDLSGLMNVERLYRSLLEKTRTANPDVKLVLCSPFMLPVGRIKEKEGIYELHLSRIQELSKTLAKEFNAVWVDFQKVMTQACKNAPAEYWMWDGIHPTAAGHELLAREWIRTVGKEVEWIPKTR